MYTVQCLYLSFTNTDTQPTQTRSFLVNPAATLLDITVYQTSDSSVCPLTKPWPSSLDLLKSWSRSATDPEPQATGLSPSRLHTDYKLVFSCFHQPCPFLLCTVGYCHGSRGRLGTLAPLLWLWFLHRGHTREGQGYTKDCFTLC